MKPEKIEKIRFWMGSKLPKWMYHVAVFFRVQYKNLRMPEQKKCFGKLNPEKVFYVIRLFPPATGFLANYNYVLGYMKYAFDKGWIPVIDMENYATLYQEDEPINGTRNVWEYFFEQPYDQKTQKRYTLQEVYKSQNVILAKADDQSMYNNELTEETIRWQHEMSLLVPFKKEMQEYIYKMTSQFLPLEDCKKILGVCTRGSDMSKRVIGHPIALSIDKVSLIIKKNCGDWDIDTIFVKAEEEETIKYLEDNFSHIYYTRYERIKDYSINKGTNVSIENHELSKVESLKNYLVDIKLLSQCTSIMGTPNNGLTTAIIWNGGKFEHCDIIDNGVWE